jgi:hypothetical protein
VEQLVHLRHRDVALRREDDGVVLHVRQLEFRL